MPRILRSFLYSIRVISFFALDSYILVTYSAELHPSGCGFIGCSLNTAAMLFLLALGFGLIAGFVDLLFRKPSDLEDWMLSAMHGMFIFLLLAALNFAYEKTPVVNEFIKGLFL